MDASQNTDRVWEQCDLRRPTKLSREQLRSLDLFHDTFSRKLSSGLGRLARSSASVEIVRTTQLTWDEYVRTLPTVTTLITASASPLPGDILIEMDTSLSLALAGRLIGGSGRMEAPRRPGELELPAVRRIASVAVEALGDALTQFLDVETAIEGIDLSPQLIGLAAPSQMVLALTYSLAVPGCQLAGDLSVVMSLSTLTPMLEKIMSHAAERAGSDLDPMIMRTVAEKVPLVLEATLSRMVMSAGSIAALVPGDVVVLDHRLNQLANVSIGEVTVVRGHLGRRGSRLAIAVAEHPFDPMPRMAAMVNEAMGSGSGPNTGAGLHGYSQVTHDVAPVDQDARQHDARNAESSSSPVHSLR